MRFIIIVKCSLAIRAKMKSKYWIKTEARHICTAMAQHSLFVLLSRMTDWMKTNATLMLFIHEFFSLCCCFFGFFPSSFHFLWCLLSADFWNIHIYSWMKRTPQEKRWKTFRMNASEYFTFHSHLCTKPTIPTHPLHPHNSLFIHIHFYVLWFTLACALHLTCKKSVCARASIETAFKDKLQANGWNFVKWNKSDWTEVNAKHQNYCGLYEQLKGDAGGRKKHDSNENGVWNLTNRNRWVGVFHGP